MAPLALLGMKKHLNAVAGGRLDLRALQHDLAKATAFADLAEGVAAWTERRTPQFLGR